MQDENTVQSSIEIRDGIACKVKWFNTAKGFGFVEPLDGTGDAFVHISVLQNIGLQGLPEGAPIVCDLTGGVRGQQVHKIHNLGPAPVLDQREGDTELIEGTVKFFNTEKGFGFVTPDDASRDIFVHMKALEKSGLGVLEAAQRVRLNVTDGEKGPLAEGVELI